MTRGKHKAEKVMGEFKRGTLRSGSGHKVKKRKQAVAIALDEAGMSKPSFVGVTVNKYGKHTKAKKEKRSPR